MPYKDLKSEAAKRSRKKAHQKYVKKLGKDKWNEWSAKRMRKNRKDDPEANWRRHLKHRYKILPTQYAEILAKQNGECAICFRTDSNYRRGWKHLCVDHDHSTGKLRGLLCSRCNLVIGNCDDNVQILVNAIHYLEQYKEEK